MNPSTALDRLRPSTIALLILAAVLVHPAGAQQRGDLNAAIELERLGRHADAAERFMRVLQADTGSVPALFGGYRQRRALRFSLPVRSRKSAFGICIILEVCQESSSGLIRW